MEEDIKETQEEGVSKMKRFLEDNLRLIVSIVIVVAIAGGIYSYSQRTQEAQVAQKDEITQEQILLEGEEPSDSMEGAILPSDDEGVQRNTDEGQETTAIQEETKPVTTVQEQTSSIETSRETDSSFVETAQAGDGTTHLARRALADYLEKNPNSGLTAAHKIYIEDYLRKSVGHTGRVFVGTELSFSKTLISQAIDAANGLSEGQLQNLQKYVPLVPSLS